MVNPTRLALHWQILIAIVLAAIAGTLAGETAGIRGVSWYAVFDFVGTMFINALKMLIVPLISSSIIVGVAGIGSSGDLGKLGGKTLLFYALTTFLAIIVGLVLVNLFSPGIVNGMPAREILALQADTGDLMARSAAKAPATSCRSSCAWSRRTSSRPRRKARCSGIIFFCLLFGYLHDAPRGAPRGAPVRLLVGGVPGDDEE